jgi:hypothetical protein
MTSSLQTLALTAILSLSAVTAGAAQAEGRPCPAESPAVTQASPGVPGRGSIHQIEDALKRGQITPYEAGRLMRQQLELAQFQRGFLDGGGQTARGASDCRLGSDIDLAPLADLASGMAKTGMQTATTLMRALMRETERLIQEKPVEELPPL